MPLRFTLSEASAITGLPVRDINKAIEKKTVPAETAQSQRLLNRASLLCLSLESKGLKDFPPKIRKNVYQTIMDNPRLPQLRQGEAVIIDIASARREITSRMLDLRIAKRMVTRDPDIMGGVPIFRGTRVPVHPIADMLASGVAVSEILAGYPSLTEKMVILSRIYAKAFPRRGRPPVQPWRTAPVDSSLRCRP
ncbi:MAG: DUF433 domain-containing protein [Terriglobales bacterium]